MSCATSRREPVVCAMQRASLLSRFRTPRRKKKPQRASPRPVGLSPGGSGVRWLSCGLRGRRAVSERIRFCASASRTAAFDLDADDGIDSELLLSQQSIASSVASPRSTPATDRKRTELTVRSQQVIYFFPPAHPVVCRGARRRRAHARGMCCRQQGGKEAASRGLSDLGSQQQQARSHVRAAGASGEELRDGGGGGSECGCGFVGIGVQRFA